MEMAILHVGRLKMTGNGCLNMRGFVGLIKENRDVIQCLSVVIKTKQQRWEMATKVSYSDITFICSSLIPSTSNLHCQFSNLVSWGWLQPIDNSDYYQIDHFLLDLISPTFN